MIKKELFKKPNNELEGLDRAGGAPSVPDELCVSCPKCKKALFRYELEENRYVCPECGRHFRMGARQRILMLCDEASFEEFDVDLTSGNPLGFPDYDMKLKNAMRASSEKEAVLCGAARIGGYPCALFAMEPSFMMGSMGAAVGEKLARLFEEAERRMLPVVGCTVSGGARMQEGMLSLMQMAKVSGAVKRHSDAGNLYIAVLTDPTTGGVTASFAMQGDILLAEPGALIGFAGPRVIEQTIRQKLPRDFQSAEFLMEKGFIDEVVDRRALKGYLARLLELHREEAAV